MSDDTQSVGTAGNLATLGPVVIKGALLDDISAVGDSGFEGAQITSITGTCSRVSGKPSGFETAIAASRFDAAAARSSSLASGEKGMSPAKAWAT